MPREPIHLGEFLTDELEELGMSATALARIIQVPANRISQIIAGKRNLTADTAPRLGQYYSPDLNPIEQVFAKLKILSSMTSGGQLETPSMNSLQPNAELDFGTGPQLWLTLAPAGLRTGLGATGDRVGIKSRPFLLGRPI